MRLVAVVAVRKSRARRSTFSNYCYYYYYHFDGNEMNRERSNLSKAASRRGGHLGKSHRKRVAVVLLLQIAHQDTRLRNGARRVTIILTGCNSGDKIQKARSNSCFLAACVYNLCILFSYLTNAHRRSFKVTAVCKAIIISECSSPSTSGVLLPRLVRGKMGCTRGFFPEKLRIDSHIYYMSTEKYLKKRGEKGELESSRYLQL